MNKALVLFDTDQTPFRKRANVTVPHQRVLNRQGPAEESRDIFDAALKFAIGRFIDHDVVLLTIISVSFPDASLKITRIDSIFAAPPAADAIVSSALYARTAPRLTIPSFMPC